MNQLNRRSALQKMGLSALGVSLAHVGMLAANETSSSQDVSKWLDQLYDNASRLEKRKISGLQWQEVMDQIYGSTPLEHLKKKIDFEGLKKTIIDKIPSYRGELFYDIDLPGSGVSVVPGEPEPHRVLICKVAYVRKGRSIPPHGHSNMSSAFLCLSGEFEVKQYDRIESQEDYMIVRKTVDEKNAGAGTWSSISDYRNNVHWLKAKTDDCFLFTCKLINLEEGRPLKGRINIDTISAEELGSETYKAPVITSKRAAELY